MRGGSGRSPAGRKGKPMELAPKLADRKDHGNPLYECYHPVSGFATGDGGDWSSIYCFGCKEWRRRHKSHPWPEVYTCRCGFETRTRW